MEDALKRLFTLRLPGWLLLIVWLFCGYKAIRSGWIQDSWGKARGYVREVNF